MNKYSFSDNIDLHLIKVLHTVLTERSVSKAAIRLGMHQPAVSASLKRLREYSGDPLLVRSNTGMILTDAAQRMLVPSESILRTAETMFSDARGFNPATSRNVFRVAASDYLDPKFLPKMMAQIKKQAPHCIIEIQALSAAYDYKTELAHGGVDVVIGNWLTPPDNLHLGQLFTDEVVCMVSSDHPAVRRGWEPSEWLNSDHIAPTAAFPGAKGVIDEYLAVLGLQRNISARCPHFGLIPEMVASTLLILTTGRQYCERYLHQLPVKILACPIKFPPLKYYQLWHDRTHASASAKWLRDCIKSVAINLRVQ